MLNILISPLLFMLHHYGRNCSRIQELKLRPETSSCYKTFCLFKHYSDWWSNCEFIYNNSITTWESQKRYHFRDNEYETTDINVSPRRHMTCVEFILHKCDKMGFISMKRSRLQGKFDIILILWIRNDFIEIFGVKYNLVL